MQLGQIQQMNKSTRRYETLDPISKIQANLKVMKFEVGAYLRKHSVEKVSPFPKPRHHIFHDAINQIGSVPQGLRPQKMVKELSSQKLGHLLEGDRFQPLRESQSDGKEKNKIVKQKRTFSSKNQLSKGLHAEISRLLPNISNLKLEFDDQNILNQATPRHRYEERYSNLLLEHSYEPKSQSLTKRYNSIDINRNAFFDTAIKSPVSSTFKSLEKHPFIEEVIKTSKKYKNLSYSEYNHSYSLTQTFQSKLRVKDAHCQSKDFGHTSKKLNQVQSIIHSSAEQTPRQFNQILRNSPQFEDTSHNIQRRKVYIKLKKQLQKKSEERNPNIFCSQERHKISNLQRKNSEKHEKLQIQNEFKHLEPWQDENQQRYNPQFVFQNNMF